MKTRTKYMIVLGIIGLFVSYFVASIVFGVILLLVFGDTPPTPTQNSFFSIIAKGIFIITWLLLIYLGYRLGSNKEKISQ